MAAISQSSGAHPYFKPTTADAISQLEDHFARLFYKYLFEEGKIVKETGELVKNDYEHKKRYNQYIHSLNYDHRFALSDGYEKDEVIGFLEYLKKRGVFNLNVPIESIIVVDSVPLIEQFGFENTPPLDNNIKISDFIHRLTGKLRMILLNYEIVNVDGQSMDTGDHWVYVELSKKMDNQRAITATIIDSKVVDPRHGDKTTANLVTRFVNEAVKKFWPDQTFASAPLQISGKTTKLKSYLKAPPSSRKNP